MPDFHETTTALKERQWSRPDDHPSLVTRHASLSSPFRWFAIFLIRFYQSYIRPHLVGQCKFTPHCSEYAIGCIEKHGLFKGGWYTTRRLCRCHPFSKGGIDPVP